MKQSDDHKKVLMTAKVFSGTSMKDYLKKNKPKEMSVHEKDVLCNMLDEAPELPYPLKELPLAYGKPAMAYEIPEDKRAEVLRELYPFVECPAPEDTIYDLHECKFFKAKEFIAIRERNRNMLASPYYASTGGMVVDWIPEASFNEFEEERENDESMDVMTFAQEAKKIFRDSMSDSGND